MTRDQRMEFQQTVEETKRALGLGARDQLRAKELQAIRDEILRKGHS